jgi:hypothetical protein
MKLLDRNFNLPTWVAALLSALALLLFAALSGAASTGGWELVTHQDPPGSFRTRLLLTVAAAAAALAVGFLGAVRAGKVVNSLRPFRRIEAMALETSTHLVTPVSVLFPPVGAVKTSASELLSAEPDLDQETAERRAREDLKAGLVQQHRTDLLAAVSQVRTAMAAGGKLEAEILDLSGKWEPVRPFGPILGAVLRSFSTVEHVALVPSSESSAEARMLKAVLDELLDLRGPGAAQVTVEGADYARYVDYNDVKSVYDTISAVVAGWQEGRPSTGAEAPRVCVLATPGSTGAAIGAAMVTMSETCVFEFVPQTDNPVPLRFDVVIETGTDRSA